MAVFRRRKSEELLFPSGARQRFLSRHPELTSFETVEAATRQWLRLAARRPRARLAMPSVLVEDFCRELALHDQQVKQGGDGGLPTTYRLARGDEGCELPLLFRIDQELGVAGGRRYLADCGGRGVCYEVTGTICLQHLTGSGKRPGGGRWDFQRASEQPGSITDNTGGCGG